MKMHLIILLLTIPMITSDADDGFTKIGDTYYKLFKNKIKYTDAATACRKLQAILAEPSTEAKNSAIQTLVKNAVNDVWLGATDIAKEGTWTWESNKKVLSYTNWDSGEPDNGAWNDQFRTEDDCLATTANAWFDSDCRFPRAYICTKPSECDVTKPCLNGGSCSKTHSSYRCNCAGTGYQGRNCSQDVNECTNSPCLHGGQCVNNHGGYTCDCVSGWTGTNCSTAPEVCPTGFSQRGTQCYMLVNHTRTYSGAVAYCSDPKVNGFLTEPLTDKENGNIQSIMKEENTVMVWIGAEENPDHGFRSFVWNNAGNMTHLQWAPNQPSPWEDIQGCLTYQVTGSSTGWNDHKCYDELPFICQSKEVAKILV